MLYYIYYIYVGYSRKKQKVSFLKTYCVYKYETV